MDKIEGKDSYVGQSDYLDTDVFIEKGSDYQMLITVKHELMHIWLYEHGHKNQQGVVFNYEDLCELSALSNSFVYKISENYKRSV